MNDQNKTKRSDDRSREPVMSEGETQGKSAGAVSVEGGALGSATGASLGPLGTAIDPVIGTSGYFAGSAAESRDEVQHLSRFIDFKVIDSSGDKVGSVDAVWEDSGGQPYYLAVKTGWLGLGKAHVVPAHNADVNETKRTIRLPFTSEQVKNAPTFDGREDVTADSDRTLRDYFGIPAPYPEETSGVADDAYANAESRDQPAEVEDETRIPLKEETVTVGKREVEFGGIRLRKIVRTETVNQPVELKREEIVIERESPTGIEGTPADESFSDEEIYIPLRREEPVVQKSVRVREEVRVGKRDRVDSEQVSESVRHEDVEIEETNQKPAGKDTARR